MKPKKIILIVIDTLRADHLGCYGYKRVTSPNIDKFEKECVLFKHPFTYSSYTVPSITSILTGKYPNSHCTGFSNGRPTKNIDTDIFLAEVLSSENYETAAFISALVMGKDRHVAITSGFKEYNDRMTNSELNRPHELIRCGEDTNKDIFKWLQDNYTKDFFLFIHYFDVHGPYINPDNYNNIFVNDEYYGEPKIIDKIVTDNRAVGGIPEYQVLKSIRDKEGKLINFQKDLRYYIAQYDGGIKYCDDRICDLLDLLKDLNIYDDCLIVLTSDHGESLGENDVYFFHGLTVTPDQICVPLMIKFHKGFDIDPKVIDVHVSLVDIMSTILDIVGFEYKNLYLQGESLLKLMEEEHDETIEDRTIIAEIEGQIAYIDSKIINVKPKKVDKNNLVFFYIEELCNKEIKFNYKKDEKMLEWTGERFIPWMQNGEIHYEHIHRYALACQLVKGKKVLDLACGEGYGSYMLSKNAELIIGIDLDEATVNHARNRYTAQNLEFMRGSILDIPIKGKEEFDIIVCFEAIEHVEEHEKLLSEVKRLLKNDGLFIVSSPNKKTYSDEPNFVNPFHKKELYFGDFKDLLDKYFEESIFFGQKVYNGSNIWPLPPYSHSGYKEFVIERQDKEFDFSDVYKKSPQYFIAISSDKKLGQENFLSSNLLDISNVLVKDHQYQIDKLVNTTNNQINDFKQCLQAKDSQINDFEQRLQAKDSQINDFEQRLQAKDSQINDFEQRLQAKDSQISELKNEFDKFNHEIQCKIAHVKELETANYQKEILIQEKDACVAQLLSSKSWKLTAPLRFIHKNIRLLNVWERRKGIWIYFAEHSKFYRIRRGLRQNRNNNSEDIQKIQNQVTETNLQEYFILSKKIDDAKKKRIENIRPKSPRIISVDESQLSDVAKSIQFLKKEEPKVSIIIPVYNNEKLTIECLMSISKNTKDISYEIIIVDDGSSEKMQDILSQIKNITYIRNSKNLGFLLSCNRAAEKACGEFILILNNDTQVMENWLKPLVETFSQFENVGAVGPKVLYPNGRLQEAGAAINKDVSAKLIGLFDDPTLPKYNYIREVDYCSGVCLITPTKLFRELKGFDTNFVPGYYEDADLCFRLRNKGFRILYNFNSTIIHHLSATSNNINKDYKMQNIFRNRQKFAEKWQKQIDDLNNIKLIAFYLPQYHPIPENDRWWGKGFTEWNNVTKAQPNFMGHYQPRIPSDLGYYDLRIDDVMEQQARLAKRYGIYGFCFYYYWFNGKRLLDLPLERMLSGKPDIPFCICWANENWTRKWDGENDSILIAQQYSDDDDIAVIKDMIRYMRHKNYIRINGKPVLLIYRINLFPNIRKTVKVWREFCRKEGIGEIYIVRVNSFDYAVKNIKLEEGFDASVEFPPHDMSESIEPPGKLLNPNYTGVISDYRKVVLNNVWNEKPLNTHFRTVFPSWDNTARRQNDSYIFAHSSPYAYKAWLEKVLEVTHEENFGDERIVFINAWNEWAEGNYLEPDKHFGHGYLEATLNALEHNLLDKEK